MEFPNPGWYTLSDVTVILSRIDDGNPEAAEQLLPLIYDELRKMRRSTNWPRFSLKPPNSSNFAISPD
jgi:hypothetical protein